MLLAPIYPVKYCYAVVAPPLFHRVNPVKSYLAISWGMATITIPLPEKTGQA